MFELAYEKEKKAKSVKEVWLTIDQLHDVFKNKAVGAAIRDYCVEAGRVQEHPQAPGCIEATQCSTPRRSTPTAG